MLMWLIDRWLGIAMRLFVTWLRLPELGSFGSVLFPITPVTPSAHTRRVCNLGTTWSRLP
jgi:hypothetical protein